MIRIDQVSGYRDVSRFIDVPHAIYCDDPHWIAPISLERRIHLSRHNPYFQHAKMCAWTAFDGNRAVGRITAQIDDLQLERCAEPIGAFGFIEAIDEREVFERLFAVAETWLAERGIQKVRGPFNLSINDECGLLVDGFDSAPSIMMGHGREYYADHVEACGYEKAIDTLAYRMHPDYSLTPTLEKIIERSNRARSGELRLRTINRKDFAAEIEVLRDIFNDSWQNNWGFVPFTEAEFRDVGSLLKAVVSDEYIVIGEIDAKPVSFIVCLPNVNEMIADLKGRLLPFGWMKLLHRIKRTEPQSARVPLMGIRQEYQRGLTGGGISLAMINEIRNAVVKRGGTEVEMGWILETNKSMRSIIEAIGGVVAKRYRVYEKTLNRANTSVATPST